MLSWEEDGLKLMSDNDAIVKIKPSYFSPVLEIDKANIKGKYGKGEVKDEMIEILLLEGEVIPIFYLAFY